MEHAQTITWIIGSAVAGFIGKVLFDWIKGSSHGAFPCPMHSGIQATLAHIQSDIARILAIIDKA